MEIGSLLILIAIAVLVTGVISLPLWNGSNSGLKIKGFNPLQRDQQRSALLAEKDRVLNALQELDFDHAEGKITQADYPPRREALLQQGASILRDLEYLGNGLMDTDESHPDQILPVDEPSDQNDEIEEMIATHRGDIHGKATGFCPKCGRPVGKEDKFCPRCGARL